MKTTTEKGFRIKIREACSGVGTYRPEFEEPIARLAKLYVRLGRAEQEWKDAGSPFLLTQVNKGGNEYFVQHPLLKEIDNTSERISAMEKALGLTPEAIHKINEAALGKKPRADDDPLALALGELKLLRTGS